ncbi:MAG: TSUP family transporter [Candidatus Villigracilaceae bacterium]
MPIDVMSSTALVLNMVVATISFVNYVRARHFRSQLLFPFLLASVPAAFVGGSIQLSQATYMMLLYGVLTYLAVRMILFPTLSEAKDWQSRPLPLWLALLSGAIIGLLQASMRLC